jgi:hypothetical protein
VGYRTQSPDTSFDIEQILIDAYRRMPPWEKAQRVRDTTLAVEALALAGIRARHPAATARECCLRLASLRLGRDIMTQVFGWDPVEHSR